MSKDLQQNNRKSEIDQVVAHDLENVKFRNYQFLRLVAVKKHFLGCDFSYSEFDSAYLRNCIFDSCNFTGCKFTNSNLRGSKFEGCKFDYASFSNTQVEEEILDTGCPSQENMQKIFARALRTNFSQIGDAKATNKAISIELEATLVHLKKAWSSRESYYRKKYKGLERLRIFGKWLEFVLLHSFWGNGESPIKLLRSLSLVVFSIALADVYFLRDGWALSSYMSSILQSPEVFLGITKPEGYSGLVMAGITSLRYILFACFVSILIKRLGRR